MIKKRHIGFGRFLIVVFIVCSPLFVLSSAKAKSEIVFLTWKPNKPGIWHQLISRFQKSHPDIIVRLQIAPHSATTYHAVVTQRLKNKDQSLDVFLMDVTWPREFISAGWVMDLSKRFPESERKKFLKAPIRANSYKGKIFGVPSYIASGIFYYRKDLLKKYNLSVPTTWEEMIKTGQKIREKEKTSHLWTYCAQFKQYEGLVCNMLEIIWSNGGEVFNPASGKINLNSPEVLSAIEFVRDKIIGGNSSPRGVLNYEEPESLSLFIQGRAIFHRNWPYAWSIINDPSMSRVAGLVDVTTLPAFQGKESFSALGGWQFGISAFTNRSEEAWKFVDFMTSYKSQRFLAIESGLAPTREAVYKDKLILQKMPHLTDFLPVFKRARTRPLSPFYPVISQELQRFFSKAISNPDIDISRIAVDTTKRLRKIVKFNIKAR